MEEENKKNEERASDFEEIYGMAMDFIEEGASGDFKEYCIDRVKREGGGAEELARFTSLYDKFEETRERGNAAAASSYIRPLMETLSDAIIELEAIRDMGDGLDEEQSELLPILDAVYDALASTTVVRNIRNSCGISVYGESSGAEETRFVTVGKDTRHAFFSLINERAWYKGLGFTPQAAYSFKRRFQDGTLTDDVMKKILEDCGWQHYERWVKPGS